MNSDEHVATGGHGGPHRLLKPVRLAGLLAGLYCIAAVGYIVISSRVAAAMASSMFELSTLEIIKGTVFVIATAAALFGVCYWLLVDLRGKQQQVAEHMAAAAEAERSAMAGIFASAVAHDINNALAVSLTAVEEIRRSAPAEAPSAFDRLTESLASIRDLSSRLMKLRGGDAEEPVVSFDLAATLRETIGFARHHTALTGSDLRLDLDQPEIPFTGRPQLIERAVLNMILNSAEAADGGGTILVSSRRVAPDTIELTVDDDGPGVPVDEREAVLQPFYTTKPAGVGIGSLSVVACANEHHGAVEIGVSPLGGARITLELRSTPPDQPGVDRRND